MGIQFHTLFGAVCVAQREGGGRGAEKSNFTKSNFRRNRQRGREEETGVMATVSWLRGFVASGFPTLSLHHILIVEQLRVFTHTKKDLWQVHFIYDAGPIFLQERRDAVCCSVASSGVPFRSGSNGWRLVGWLTSSGVLAH